MTEKRILIAGQQLAVDTATGRMVMEPGPFAAFYIPLAVQIGGESPVALSDCLPPGMAIPENLKEVALYPADGGEIEFGLAAAFAAEAPAIIPPGGLVEAMTRDMLDALRFKGRSGAAGMSVILKG